MIDWVAGTALVVIFIFVWVVTREAQQTCYLTYCFSNYEDPGGV